MDCLFCKISNKELPGLIIEENENFVCFLDIKPHSPGHSLIVPKKHIINLADLPENLAEDLVLILKKIILKISEKLLTKDFTIGINDGKLAGRVIEHLHIHIIPRYPNDRGGSIHSIVYNPPKQSVEEIYRLLTNES